MAKKKAPGKKPSPKKPPGDAIGPMPTAREMEDILRQLVSSMGLAEPAEPESRAEGLLKQAHEARDPKKRVALAKQALAADLDAVDAYLLLAEEAPTRKVALSLYEEAVAAGERTIGPDGFREMAGNFWGIMETRPYMRARERLAHELWIAGRREEAVEHFREMLRLNPGDNQGVRYALMSWLPFLGRDDDLEALLDEYPEGGAFDSYARTLLAFRRFGDSPEAAKQLREAREANKFVPDLLTGLVPMPTQPPPYYSPGDPNEAVFYAKGALPAWKATPGATTWLRSQAPEVKSGPKPKKKASKPPSAAAKTRLKKRKQNGRTWEVGIRPMKSPIQLETEPASPWVVLIASPEEKLVAGTAIFEDPPEPAELWDAIVEAIEHPSAGKSARPAVILHQADPAWEPIKASLEEIGIEVEEVEELEAIDFLFESMTAHLSGPELPGLLEIPDVSPAQAAAFFKAAADFYRAAPWRTVGSENVIRVDCDKYPGGPCYALVMGQSGMTLGLALYDDLKLLRRMWAGETTAEENAVETVALTITFDPEDDANPVDVEAAERFGWDVAGPEAFPSTFRKERGMTIRPPVAWELELLEACLASIPGFAARHPIDDTSRHPTTAPTSAGAVGLVLSWVGEG